MLVVYRRAKQRLKIGDDVTITVVEVDVESETVKLRINAPRSVDVWRDEIYQRIQLEKSGQRKKGK